MTSIQKAAIIGGVAIAALGASMLITDRSDESKRTGTEQLSAEEVVDLEVQAQKEYVARNGIE